MTRLKIALLAGGDSPEREIALQSAAQIEAALDHSKYDITVIDRDAKALEEVGTLADIITVEGDSTTFEALRKASTRKCDLFIAKTTTSSRR